MRQHNSIVMHIVLAGAIVASLLAGGCGISETIYNRDVNRLKAQVGEVEGERDQYRDELAVCRKLTEAGADDLATCQRELAALRSDGKALSKAHAEALERVGQLLRITKAQKAVFDKLRSALDELVRAGKLSVGIVRGQFTVNMAEKILFDSGKSDLKAEAKETLAELASILGSIPERRYQVAGHTDSRGSDGFNWKLSGARARAVLNFMIEKGMAPQRISYAGYGEYQPTAPNDTSDNMALNRRIEVVLVPDMEAFLKPFAGGS